MPRRKNRKISQKQLFAIRANYARMADLHKQSNDFIPVDIKTHGDINGGHFHVIMDNIGDNHVSVGLSTKKKKGKNGGTNYTMEKSPFDDGIQSYMRRQAMIAPKNEYYNQRKGSLTPTDYAVAKRYSDRAIEKYRESKNKKK